MIRIRKKNNKTIREEYYIYGRIIYERIDDKEVFSRLVQLFNGNKKRSSHGIILNKSARVKKGSIEIDTESLKIRKLKKELKKIVSLLKKLGISDVHVHIVSDGPKENDIRYYRLRNRKLISSKHEQNNKNIINSIILSVILIIVIISILSFVGFKIYI